MISGFYVAGAIREVAARRDEPALGGGSVNLGALPEWNLRDLYSAPDGADLSADFAAAEQRVAKFEIHRGNVAALDSAAFGSAIAEFEAISEILGKIGSYAQLFQSGDVSSPERGRFYQNTVERLTALSGRLLFFTLEINRLDDKAMAAKMMHARAAHYAPWVRDLRVMRAHELSDDLERLFLDKSTTGRTAWVRLFDETQANMRCKAGDEELTLTAALNRLTDPQAERRKAAAKAIGAALGDQVQLFTLITNVLAKDKALEDEWRKFPRPVSSRNLANLVEDEVVDALVSGVKGAYADTAHRYYALKAKWLGKEKLDYWDRNAPLPTAKHRDIPWAEARDTVREAYAGFSPKLAKIVDDFFAKSWIDAPARPGKASGAFSHPTVPSAHPYILLNYLGSPHDVQTLAHELGHGVHQVLAAPQGALISNTPLTLAETASVFGEMLTFRALLAAESDPVQRRALLAGKVEDMLNTVIRQIAFHDFERQVHDARKTGELSQEQIGEIWLNVAKDSLGPALRFDDEYKYYWGYISHFLHVPFYVYAYAFGDCLVNALYDVYTAKSVPDFEGKYLDMLAAGGKLRHKELLAPFGLDAGDPGFWRRGMKTIEGFIDELEKTG
ncbi:MAG: M3 family oligoendopeptidase [Rhodospirillaceae bacterium]|nr:M3 family oligoendopeptidase [Rhodospirillaceae bacterium]